MPHTFTKVMGNILLPIRIVKYLQAEVAGKDCLPGGAGFQPAREADGVAGRMPAPPGNCIPGNCIPGRSSREAIKHVLEALKPVTDIGSLSAKVPVLATWLRPAPALPPPRQAVWVRIFRHFVLPLPVPRSRGGPSCWGSSQRYTERHCGGR